MNSINPEIAILTPRLRSDLSITVARRDGHLVHLLEDPIQGRVFQIGQREATFLLAMDGKKSISEFASETADQLTNDEIERLFQWAHQKSLWYDHSEAALGRDRRSFTAANRAAYFKWLNPISIQWSLGSPQKYVDRFARYGHWLFSRWSVLAFFGFGLFAFTQFWPVASQFADQTSQSLANGGWLLMLGVWLIAKLLHETAHAVACHRAGAQVSDCGMIFVVLMPLAFVDVSSANRLPRRSDRISISAAGVYLETWLTFAAMLLWAMVDWPVSRNLAQAWIVTSGITTLLFNANPLMRFDGYYILADLLDISNLAARGRSVFWNSISTWLLGWSLETSPLTGWRSVATWCYGGAAVVWKVLLTATLILAASALYHGAGILMAILAVVFWVIVPAYRIVQMLISQRIGSQVKPVRCATSALTVLTLLTSCGYYLSGPAWLSAPAVVQLAEGSRIRVKASGFVSKILIHDGQVVEPGQPLIQLENPELENKVYQLELEIQKCEIRSRLHRQSGEWAEQEADENELDGLQRQLAERKLELQGLTVCATDRGQIIQPHLHRKIGTWVQQGELLLTLHNDNKELKASVSQDDLPSLKENFQQTVAVKLTGQPRANAQFTRLVPNASHLLIADSLGRPNGGPLEVVPGNYSEAQNDNVAWRLTQPRFVATLKFENRIQNMPLGQTGQIYFRSVKQSLGSYLFLSARQWFRKHLPRIS